MQTKFLQIENEINTNFIARQNEIRGLMLATLSRQHILFLGPNTSNLKSIVATKHNIDTLTAMIEDTEAASKAIEQIQIAQDAIAKAMILKPEDVADTSDKHALRAFQDDEDAKTGIAMTNATDGIDALVEFASIMGQGWGSSEGNRLIEFGLDENLMKTIKGQTAFKKIMQSLGRIRLMAGEIKSRKPKQSPQPMGLTQGSDLTSLVPQEYAMLGDPDLEDLFIQRFTEGNLMQYDRRIKQREGRGPIVVCIDKSGSMNGQNETNADAFFMQMVRTAQDQKRRVCLIPFATHAADPMFIENTQDLIRIATQANYAGIGRGTDFEQPLRKARLAINNEIKYKNADIIFLTDGISSLPANFIQAFLIGKNELGFRVMGVLFGSGMQWGKDMLGLLDQSIEVDNSGGMEWVEKLLERIV